MLITELRTFLSRLYDDTEKAKTVLIEGKWGCGKTYVIRDYLKKRKTPANIIYLSLFGLSSSEELLLHLADELDSSTIASFGNSFVVIPSLEEQEYNETLIIFDDLERVDENLSYSSIYGIVNSLMMLGFKVLCVSCERKDKMKRDYFLFKEKTFDLFFTVEADKKSCEDMLGKTIKITDSMIKSANENLRTLKRAKLVYDKLTKKIAKRQIDFFEKVGISKDDYFEHIILAERCYYSSNEEEPDFNTNNNEFSQISYNEDLHRFKSVSIANEIYSLKSTRAALSLDIVRDLIDYLRTEDFDKYFSKYHMVYQDEVFDSEPILKKEPFLLSDSEKKKYSKAFLSSIGKFNFDDPAHFNVLISFLKNSIKTISNKEKEKLLNSLVKRMSKSVEERVADEILFSPERKELVDFIRTLQGKAISRRTAQKSDELLDSIKRKDYKSLSSIIEKSKNSTEISKKMILDVLKKEDFALPDFSETTDYLTWKYCHEIAKFVSGTDFEDAFIEVLEKQCRNRPHSLSVREKCNALVKYNLDHTYVDFSKKYPIVPRRANPKR